MAIEFRRDSEVLGAGLSRLRGLFRGGSQILFPRPGPG